MQGVPGLGHGAAEHATVTGADRVLVFQVGAQRVGRSIDLATLRAGAWIRGADPHHVQRCTAD